MPFPESFPAFSPEGWIQLETLTLRERNRERPGTVNYVDNKIVEKQTFPAGNGIYSLGCKPLKRFNSRFPLYPYGIGALRPYPDEEGPTPRERAFAHRDAAEVGLRGEAG